MYIPIDDTQNIPSVEKNQWWWKRFNPQLNEITIRNSVKVPKVVKPTYKKTLL